MSVMRERIRFFHRLWFYIIPTAYGRTRYLKKHGILAEMGDNITFQPRVYPMDADFLKIHNNVHIARDVNFIMHDIMMYMFRGLKDGNSYEQNRGCIEIMDNVFIGSGSQICPNIRIGPNAIVATGAVVTKDVPPGEVWGGVPARKIGDFESVRLKQLALSQSITGKTRKELREFFWNDFYKQRE